MAEMTRDEFLKLATLYLLPSDIHREDGGPFFCPECAMIEGYLSYFPQLRQQMMIRYIAYDKPRQPLAEIAGPENQGCPALVIAGPQRASWGRPAGQVWLIDDPKQIMSCISTYVGVGHRLPPRPVSI